MNNLNKQKASIGQRIIAQSIDGLIPYAAGYFLMRFGLIIGLSELVNLITAIIIALIIFLVLDALPNGQSPGKKLLGLSVIDFVTGEPCSLRQSVIRNFVLLVFGYIDLLFVFSKSGRRLGDKWANTYVIRLESDLDLLNKK